MSTRKIINNKPIKNNGGVVYSEGTLSSLSPIARSTQIYDNTVAGTKGGAATRVVSQYFKTVDVANVNNKVFVSQDRFYTSFPSGISYVTGAPTAVIQKTGTFWLNQRRRFNNLSGFIFGIGDQIKFSDTSNLEPKKYTLLKSSLVNGKQTISFSLNNNKNFFPSKIFSIYSGEVSPSNETHYKSYSVEYVKDGVGSNTFLYDLDGWHKANIFTQNHNSVNITQNNESSNPFWVGFRDISEATGVARTVALTTSIANPYTFIPNTNLQLSSEEKAIRITSGNTAQIMIVEKDSANNNSPVVYNIIPSGSKMTYYPSYPDIAIGEVQGRSLTVEVLK